MFWVTYSLLSIVLKKHKSCEYAQGLSLKMKGKKALLIG